MAEFYKKTCYLFSFIVIVLLFAPVLFELMKYWRINNDYSHGFFIIPISIYMIWVKREKISALTPKPQWAGVLVMIVFSIFYVVSVIIKFHSLSHLSMIVLLIGTMISIFGWAITKELLAPILFLSFMFPIPSAYYVMITNPLKLFITNASVVIIQFFGIPIYQEGNLIFMPDLHLEVAEACSGIRSIYSYLMLSCLFAWFSKGIVKQTILISSAIPIAIGINIFRVSITGILSHYYGEKVAQGFFHEFTGIVLFGIGFGLLLIEYSLIKNRFRKTLN